MKNVGEKHFICSILSDIKGQKWNDDTQRFLEKVVIKLCILYTRFLNHEEGGQLILLKPVMIITETKKCYNICRVVLSALPKRKTLTKKSGEKGIKFGMEIFDSMRSNIWWKTTIERYINHTFTFTDTHKKMNICIFESQSNWCYEKNEWYWNGT